MIQYMFDRRADKWFMKDTKEEVTILRQKYFAKAKDGKKYTAEGTDWALFADKALNLIIGNEQRVQFIKDG